MRTIHLYRVKLVLPQMKGKRVHLVFYRTDIRFKEGVQKRIPEIKKVLPVTIDEEMSKTIQGLSKGECPVLFILIPSGTGASLSADNVRENNLCVIFLMNKYDPQRKGAYETIEEVQPDSGRVERLVKSSSLVTGQPVAESSISICLIRSITGCPLPMTRK